MQGRCSIRERLATSFSSTRALNYGSAFSGVLRLCCRMGAICEGARVRFMAIQTQEDFGCRMSDFGDLRERRKCWRLAQGSRNPTSEIPFVPQVTIVLMNRIALALALAL